MIYFPKTYKEKMINKIYKAFKGKRRLILDYKNGQNKVDTIVVSQYGIFIFNIYDSNGIIDEASKEEKLWFLVKPNEEDKPKQNKENYYLTKSTKANTLTIPFDSQINKITIINPYFSLNRIKDYILKIINENYEIDLKEFPIYVYALFNNIKNIDDYDFIYNFKRFKLELKSKEEKIKLDELHAYCSLIKTRG